MANKKFTCSVCGDEQNMNVLSEYSYFNSGQDSAEKAVEVLKDNDIICSYCTGELEPVAEHRKSSVQKAEYLQNHFGIDILNADEGMRSFIEQNY